MATKDITPVGTTWPTFKSVKNLEEYDAADDEAVAQAQANAAKWLQERATRIKDLVDDTDATTYNGAGSDSWQDTAIETTLTITAGDILTVWVSFEAIAAGDGADQYAYFRIKIVDGATTTSREAAIDAPASGASFANFTLIGQRQIDTTGTVTITLQTKNSHTTVQTNIATGATILPIVERRKAEDA